MAGDSGTPPPKKLGIAPGRRVVLVDAPDGFEALLEPIGDDGPPSRTLGRGPWDLALLFAPDRAALVKQLPRVQAKLDPDGAVVGRLVFCVARQSYSAPCCRTCSPSPSGCSRRRSSA